MALSLTGSQLIKVVPNMAPARANAIADRITTIAPGYGINTPDILHEFLANVAHESGGFRVKEENMNYSAKRLRQVWPSRFKTLEAAGKYAHQPEKLANLVYGGRMGNFLPGDGWTFRGGGFIQLTGRDMYTKYGKWLGWEGDGLPEAVRTDDFYALDSACWLFAIEKKLIDEAISDQFERVVRSINGGVIGLSDRQAYYQRAKRYVS
jgi:putative chitinase